MFFRIDSVHNKQVVEQVALELDGKYTLDQIRSKLWTIRKQINGSNFPL